MTPKNPVFMTGVPELLLLKLLAGQEMYGYEIARAVKAATGDGLSLGEGVLYPALHALERRGLLRSRTVRTDGRSRIYYVLTSRGSKRLLLLTRDWQRISSSVNAILGITVVD